MSYDAIMHKLSSAELTLSPQMQDVIQRVRETGLHKVAAPLYGIDELTLKTAVQQLSTSLLAQHYKYQKIASGLESYAVVNGEKTAGLPEMLGAVKSVGQKTWGALNRPLGRAPAAAEVVGAVSGKGIAGLEAMGKVDTSFFTGGLAAPMSKEHALGLQHAGMVRENAPLIAQGNAIANKLRTRSMAPEPPPMPPAMVGSAAGSAAAKTLTSVPQFSGSKRILPVKPGQLT